MPDDLNALKDRIRRDASSSHHQYLIVKPVRGSQGKGIQLCTANLQAVQRAAQEAADDVGARGAREVLVSEYISDPLLIKGRKFDLRLYVLIESVEPLRASLYYDGLVR